MVDTYNPEEMTQDTNNNEKGAANSGDTPVKLTQLLKVNSSGKPLANTLPPTPDRKANEGMV